MMRRSRPVTERRLFGARSLALAFAPRRLGSVASARAAPTSRRQPPPRHGAASRREVVDGAIRHKPSVDLGGGAVRRARSCRPSTGGRAGTRRRTSRSWRRRTGADALPVAARRGEDRVAARARAAARQRGAAAAHLARLAAVAPAAEGRHDEPPAEGTCGPPGSTSPRRARTGPCGPAGSRRACGSAQPAPCPSCRRPGRRPHRGRSRSSGSRPCTPCGLRGSTSPSRRTRHRPATASCSRGRCGNRSRSCPEDSTCGRRAARPRRTGCTCRGWGRCTCSRACSSRRGRSAGRRVGT